MSDKKIIAVVGATGAQGGGAVRALLADGTFAVRAITRDAGSPKAKELIGLGAEVVEADLYDEQSLRQAFDGAYGAFCVTFFWAHMSAAKELTEAKNLAEAAAAANLRHVVWSTLEDSRDSIPLTDNRMPTLDEHYKVPHFDAKSDADAFFTQAGVPTTFLRTTFYWDNFLAGLGPIRDDNGDLVLTLPIADQPIAGIVAADIGVAAAGIFRDPDAFVGQTVGIAGEFLTGEQIAAHFSDLLGEKVRYQPLDHDTFRGLGFPAAIEYGNMFQYYAEFPDAFLGRRDRDLTRRLVPSLQSLSQWLQAHKAEFAGA
jgi:uncharacterized protein YbjT (DUF2867 family)